MLRRKFIEYIQTFEMSDLFGKIFGGKDKEKVKDKSSSKDKVAEVKDTSSASQSPASSSSHVTAGNNKSIDFCKYDAVFVLRFCILFE